MKGKNTIKINVETMIEATQMWLDSTMRKPHKVLSVRQVTSNGIQTETFELEIEAAEDLSGEEAR
jgi:hypothetical protein